MAWDDDSKRYSDFYFVGDKNGNLLLFDTITDAQLFGSRSCKYFKIMNWHNYMVGNKIVVIKKLVLIEK